MAGVYTVGQISGYIRNMFVSDYLLGKVNITGEVSNCKYHSSGNIYFSLKDETASLPCMMHRSDRRGLDFRLVDGQSIICSGSIDVYIQGGRYQMYVRSVRKVGLGALYEKFEALKKELAEMGMFDPIYKKPIPKAIHTLGVVTADTGAAVRDIITIAKRRNPGIQILLYPAKVQGEGAAQSVAAGLRVMAASGAQTIIIGRGGGSIEDLWAFNEELLARAVFECPVPVISAVGHETDTVITDFVADLRAPTPSAAAELAVDDVAEQVRVLRQYRNRLIQDMESIVSHAAMKQKNYALKLRSVSPQMALRDKMMRLDRLSEQMKVLMQRHIEEDRRSAQRYDDILRRTMEKTLGAAQQKSSLLGERLKGLSPYDKLENGYAIIVGSDGKRVSLASSAVPGDDLDIYLSDGRIRTGVKSVDLREAKV